LTVKLLLAKNTGAKIKTKAAKKKFKDEKSFELVS